MIAIDNDPDTMHTRADQLLPAPKRWIAGKGVWCPTSPIAIDILGEERETKAPGAHLEAMLGAAGVSTRRASGDDAARAATIRLRQTSAFDLPEQGYRLRLTESGAEITAGSASGLHHGAATLGQWLTVAATDSRPSLPLGVIEDWPAIQRRAVLLDVSRDKVPTLGTLKALADRLAGWKINELQLYLEHAFAYRGHEAVWRDASPLTADDVRELDRHCQSLGIELVPNQNSLGHLHRWLVHEPYRRLAECPEGIEHPFSRRREPFSLCPLDPGSLTLLADLYDQLFPCFASEQANVGLDETFDLGRCRSRQACAERGRESVYLDFLRQVHVLLGERRHRMQFWGDIVLEHPERLSEIPPDAIPLAWGYEASHPFAEHADRLAATGLDFYLCPGTSSWLSFGGRLDNALHNVVNAARAARKSNALGLLITDWGDQGHLQPLPVSYLPLLAGAACAWGEEEAGGPPRRNWSDTFDALVMPGAHLGGLAAGLGRVHRLLGTPDRNGTALFHLLASWWAPLDHPRYRGLGSQGLDRVETALEDLSSRARGAEISDSEHQQTAAELDWVTDVLRLAVRLGRARLAAADKLDAIPLPERQGLAQGIHDLVEERRALWLVRNRAGGLDDALAPLLELAETLGEERG